MNTHTTSPIEPTAEHHMITSTTDLRTMLADLAETASTDETIPAVNGVLLHTDTSRERPLLFGTSTDRFVVAQAHIEALSSGCLPETFIDRAELEQLLTTLAALDNPGRGAGRREAIVRLVRTGATLALHRYDIDRDQENSPLVRVDIHNREFPAIRQLLLPSPGAQQTTQLAPHHLRMFAQIAAGRGAPAVALTSHVDQARARVQVRIGDRYQAMVIAVRDQLPPAPMVSTPPSERAREARRAAASRP